MIKNLVHDWLSKQLESSLFAWWEWEIVQNKVIFNDLKVSMLGYDIADFKDCGYQKFTGLLHPDDYERTMEAMRKLLIGEANIYQIDYRIKTKTGQYKWYMDRGAIIKRDENGNPEVIRGLVLDLGTEEIPESAVDEIIRLFRKAVPLDKKEKPVISLCVQCKKIKLTRKDWYPVPDKLENLVHAEISHGLCPDCTRILYPDIADNVLQKLGI